MKNYIYPNKFWKAYQLGLYRTIINKKIHIPTKKSRLVRDLSLLTRFEIERPDSLISQLLLNNINSKWFKIILTALSPLYPQIIFSFLCDNFSRLPKEKWLVSLYIALSLKYNCFKQGKLLDYLDHDDKLLFLGNISHNHQEKLSLFNQYLCSFNLSSLLPLERFSLHQFRFEQLEKIVRAEKVTILVTTYNTSDSIAFCLRSLLNQTWQNLQIIVVDDCSTDDTLKIVKSMQSEDSRIELVELKKNVGTFVAKSIGIQYAKGDFITCQDSDDYAHPDKIKEQILPLLQNPKLVATISSWIRLDKDGNYYARQHFPYLRQNPASLLFRYKQVKQDIGLWHLVRTGADSEFIERIKLFYGNARVQRIKKPLTFASHRENSLMNSVRYGIHNQKSAIERLDYWENWRLWHIDTLKQRKKLYMPNIESQLANPVFDVPERLRINREDVYHNLAELESHS